MCVATIPFFSEIIVMAFSCEFCGRRSSEIKHGGGMSDKATKITFTAKNERDLHRDIFKSDSCRVSIPEVGLDLEPGTRGSMYTTIEGLMD
jgi:zinc finger protein